MVAQVEAAAAPARAARDTARAGAAGSAADSAAALQWEATESALGAALDAFAADVDREFPGRFVWLSRGSLHATVRGLVW